MCRAAVAVRVLCAIALVAASHGATLVWNTSIFNVSGFAAWSYNGIPACTAASANLVAAVHPKFNLSSQDVNNMAGVQVAALNANNGTVRWAFMIPFNGDPSTSISETFPPTVLITHDESRVIVSIYSNAAGAGIYCFNASNGTALWTANGYFSQMVEVRTQGALVLVNDQTVTTLNITDGSLKWSVPALTNNWGPVLLNSCVTMMLPLQGEDPSVPAQIACLNYTSGSVMSSFNMTTLKSELVPYPAAHGDMLYTLTQEVADGQQRNVLLAFAFSTTTLTLQVIWRADMNWTQEGGQMVGGVKLAIEDTKVVTIYAMNEVGVAKIEASSGNITAFINTTIAIDNEPSICNGTFVLYDLGLASLSGIDGNNMTEAFDPFNGNVAAPVRTPSCHGRSAFAAGPNAFAQSWDANVLYVWRSDQ
jgi:outer membrane protein assembly factor BamB